jgi:outer membrane lipoprotein LolB
VTLLRLAAWPLVVALLALVEGCAAVPKSNPAIGGDALSGRLSVRVEGLDGAAARSMSAAFELQGDAQNGSLNLATPLGTVLAQARWAPRKVVLATPQGESSFDDLDALTREVLGETVPVVALFDWLRGRPWPGASSAALVTPIEPGFRQLGWAISLARFDKALVTAQREQAPAVTVRAQLDRP